MHQQEKKLIKGFTLLEVLVVLSIIAIISTVAYQPFQDWRKDRETRLAAEKIRDMLVGINGQVQRGLYGFAQFSMDPTTGILSTNGMLMNNVSRKKSENSSDWNSISTRCKITEMDTYWDHRGEDNTNVEVKSIRLNLNRISFDLTTKSAICFSKDGAYYSAIGDLLGESSGSEEGDTDGTTTEAVVEWIYVCGYGGVCDPDFEAIYEDLNKEEKKKIKNVYMVSWTRFGNISLEKWDARNGNFVAQ